MLNSRFLYIYSSEPEKKETMKYYIFLMLIQLLFTIIIFSVSAVDKNTISTAPLVSKLLDNVI